MADRDFLPLRTERLTLRPFTHADTAGFAAYRNDPEVARYQSWDLPFAEEDAARLVASQESVTGPVPGDWVQIAVDLGGELAGDVAVGLDPGGTLATIGYTVRPDLQGRGIGSEAVSTLVDALFDSAEVHRVAAELDPANLASARLLERLGFRYEGRGRSAVVVRDGWADEDRYALLRADREEWRSRPTGRPAEVALVELTRSNAGEVSRLATHHTQERFVSTMGGSLRDALVGLSAGDGRTRPWLRAVYADGEPAGFVMVAEVTPARAVPYLWRLLIDRRHQRRGIGAMVVGQLVDRLRAEGHATLRVSWVEEPGGPAPFYRRLGFVPTGEVHDGEVVADLAL